ncbi:MAG: efflux RND transporter periplasmic adaptor subunit [Candidatus Sumerlaeaceae bacterium]
MSNASLKNLRIDRPADTGSRTGLWIVLVAILLAAGGTAAWMLARPQALAVRTALVRDAGGGSGSGSKTERMVLNASGYVTARREATVSSKITGKVMSVHIEEGMKVKDGQIVARLDDTNVTVSLRLAMAQMEATKAGMDETRVRLREAEKELQRQEWLATKKVASQSETDKAVATAESLKAKLQQQQAEVTVAERTIESWKQQQEDTIIRAPFGGIVTSKNAQPGEMISPMSAGGGFTRTGICTIVDMDSLEIEIDVNESYINRVVTGQAVEATLDAYPEWRIPCKVIAIIPTADRQKSTVKVRVGFEKLDPRVLPEMSVKVGFRETAAPAPEASTRSVLVPKAALSQDGDHDIVYVIRNGRAERRAVTVASATSEEATVSAGVAAGERVAVEKAPGLIDGARVKEVAP